MIDPKKQRYIYSMLAGFGAISMSVILFFILYRLQGIGEVISSVSRILAPFIYGGILAYLLRPMCNTLELYLSKKLPQKLKRFANGLSVTLSLIIGILTVYLLIAMIAPQLYVSVTTLWNTLPDKVQQFITWATSTFGEDERILKFFNENYQTYFTDIEKWFRENVVPQATVIVSGLGTSAYKVLMFLYNLLIGLIVAAYLLHGRKRYAKQCTMIIRSVFPARWANILLNEVVFIDKMFSGFIDGKIIDSGIVGVLCYIGCSIMGTPNALLISVLIGVTNIIPFFGPVIGAVPATLLILIENPIKALWFVIFVLVLQQLDGNIIGPKILGNRTGLPGFWVLFAIILFGGLWGIVGMLVCVPVFAVIYDLVKRAVRRGLKRNNRQELWEAYRVDFPEETER